MKTFYKFLGVLTGLFVLIIKAFLLLLNLFLIFKGLVLVRTLKGGRFE